MEMVKLRAPHQPSDSVPDSFRVLGVRVDAVQIPDVIAHIVGWIEDQRVGNYVAVTGMHGVVEAQQNPDFKDILNRASLVVADGMPLVWIGRRHGHNLRRRVYGPELFQTFCAITGSRYRHFFYGAPRVWRINCPTCLIGALAYGRAAPIHLPFAGSISRRNSSLWAAFGRRSPTYFGWGSAPPSRKPGWRNTEACWECRL